MKKIIILILLMSLTIFCGCKNKIEEEFNVVLNYQENIYVGENFDVSVKEGNANISYLDTERPDLFEIGDFTVYGIAMGSGIISVYFENNQKIDIEVNVMIKPVPEGVTFHLKEEGPYKMNEVYHLESKINPLNALEKVIYSSYSTYANIDLNNSTVTFTKAGTFTLIAYPEGYKNLQVDLKVKVEKDDSEYYSLMFIGNSFTYYMNIPQTIYQMIQADGAKVFINSDLVGGQYISDTFKNYEKNFSEQYYTHLILQEQSSGTVTNYNQFEDSVMYYKENLKNEDTQIILYQTWVDNISKTTGDKAKQQKIIEAYDKVASKIDAKVTRVGEAFWKYVEDDTLPYLYKEDETTPHHQNKYGAFLSSCMHYHTITGRRAQDNKYIPGNIEEEIANKIKILADSFIGE